MTQPEIYIGFTPSLAAGHGNHQQAGRYIWEGVKAAADPTMFPEQLRGQARAAHLAGQEGLLRRQRRAAAPAARRSRRRTARPASSPPTSARRRTVAGVWTGYDSPYDWPAGNVQGQPAGTPKSWAQVATEGARAYPTQSRTMFMGVQAPGCSRFGQTDAFVPFQPNVNATAREPARRPRRRDPLRRRQAGPGRPAARHARAHRALRLLRRARQDVPGDRPRALRQGHAAARHGRADRAGRLDGRAARSGSGRSPRSRDVDRDVRRDAERDRAGEHERAGSPRCCRPAARRATPTPSCGSSRRSRAASSAGASGRSTTAGSRTPRRARCASAARPPPVDGRRRDDHRPGRRPQLVRRASRAARVELALPAQLHGRRDLQAVRPARARRGRDGRVRADEHRRVAARRPQTATIPIRTTYSAPAGTGSEDLTISPRPDDDDPGGVRRAGGRRRRGRGRVRRPGARRRQALGGHGVRARSASTAARPARSATRRRARTRRSPGTATSCTSSSTSATSSRATRSSRPSASRTGSPTRSRS